LAGYGAGGPQVEGHPHGTNLPCLWNKGHCAACVQIPQAPDMIDIHSHPLPGVDDGARSFEVAIEMCQLSAEDGVTHLVATPHSNYTYTFDPGLNRQLLSELQEKLAINPSLLLGCDFHLSYETSNLRAELQRFHH